MMETLMRMADGASRAQIILGEATPVYLAAKIAGAVAGSLISVAYILPRGRREAVLRFAVGLVTGIVFGGPVGIKIAGALNLSASIHAGEIALMGAAFASLTAWWALGMLHRLSESWPLSRSLPLPDPFKKADSKDKRP